MSTSHPRHKGIIVPTGPPTGAPPSVPPTVPPTGSLTGDAVVVAKTATPAAAEVESRETGQGDGASGSPIATTLYRRRWAVLTLFTAYSMTNAYQWIHVNIIYDAAERYYNASLPENERMRSMSIDFLSLVYMIAYVPLVFPGNWLLDARGLRLVALLGSFLNAAGAWLKVASVSPDRFWLLMLAQIICAIAQVFILGLPARLAAVWFGYNEVSTATAIGVFGNQLGTALGFVIPPYVVTEREHLDTMTIQFNWLFYGGAAVTTALFLLVAALFKAAPPVPPSKARQMGLDAEINDNFIKSIKRLFTNWPFMLLTLTYGLNVGSYYAVSTLLSRIVFGYFKPSDYPSISQEAGWIGLTLVVAGLLGSIVAGIWLDRTKTFKGTTAAIYAMSLAGMVGFTFILDLRHIWLVYTCAGLLGLFMTGYIPVGFEYAVELTFPESEGTSSGVLNASAQIFGITLTLTMGELMPAGAADDTDSIRVANLCLCGVLLIGVLLTFAIKSDLRRQKAEHCGEVEEKDISEGQVVNLAHNATTQLKNESPLVENESVRESHALQQKLG